MMKNGTFPLMLQITTTNMGTEETKESGFFLFPSGARINTIVRIENVRSYMHGDNSLQISVDCLALDSIGNVFALDMEFTPESTEEMEVILNDLQTGRLFFVNGDFCVLQDESSITIYDAEYKPIKGELAENAAKTFRVNSGDS